MIDTTLSRRHLLAGASATAAATFVGSERPAAAKAPLLKTLAPAFYRFNVGNVEATVVSDGLIVGVPKATFVGPAAVSVEKMMTDRFLPADKLVMDQNALVINTGDKLALFETGMASVKRTEDMGLLIGNLKAAGIDPKDIDYVIPSHAHIDHVGGILAADGSRNFPMRKFSSRRRTSNTGRTKGSPALRQRARCARRARISCLTAIASSSTAMARRLSLAFRPCTRPATLSAIRAL
jgi:Metallo-beta-lactamase superfamily